MFASAPPGPSISLELLVTETGAEYGLAGWLGRPPTPGMVVRRGSEKTANLGKTLLDHFTILLNL